MQRPVLSAQGILPQRLGWKTPFNLELHAGEIVVIHGPNGAGKTSLLAVLNGSAVPKAGACRIDGRPVTTLHGEERRRALAFVPQTEPRPDGFTVRERVSLATTDQHRVDDALRTMGLDRLAQRPVANLSGGEARRCSLAAALAQDSRCLIADEPTNHMDPEWTAETGAILTKLAHENNVAILIVLHDIALAKTIGHRLVTISDDGPQPIQTLATAHNSEPDQPNTPIS